MKARVAKFIKAATEGLLRVRRMSTLDAPEAKSIACGKTVDFGLFLRSIKFDSIATPSDDVGPLQSDILTEATEALEYIQESVTIGYELLDHPDLTDRAAGLLEDLLDCLEDLLDFSLPKIIETRRNERQNKTRPAYGIIAHGALCSNKTFVVPRGCTIVFLAPPGGFTFIWWTAGKMMEQRLIDDVREGKGYKKLYMVYYHEGSVVRDQLLDEHEPTESDWMYTGVVKLPLPRRRSRDVNIVERIRISGSRLSDLVRADRPGIYVVNSCRVTTDDKTWENTIKRNVRALGQDGGADQRRRLLACKDRHACKRFSFDSHFGFWWQLHPRAWVTLYEPDA